jgi:uncharacterized protein YbjQ (UPF0145 family)
MHVPVTTTFTFDGYRIVEYKGIVGVRYDTSEVVSKGSATEVLCYGTAVVVEPVAGPAQPTSPT